MAIYYLSLTISFLILSALASVIYKFKNSKFELFYKIVGVVIGVVLLFRYALQDLYLEDVIYPESVLGFTSFGSLAFSAILMWVEVPFALLVILYPFFKKVKTVRVLTSFASPLMFVLSTVCLKNLLLANFGVEIYGITLRAVLLSVEVGLCLAVSVLSLVNYILNIKTDDYKFNAKTIIFAVLSVIGMVMVTMPNYIPQLLLNPNKYAFKVDDLNIYHRLYLYPIVIVPIALYLILKDKSEETKNFALIYYALSGLFLYTLTHKFEDFTNVSGLPFHLCNTALYITPLCLIFKWKKVFYFTYFINVLGAFLAMALPNYNMDGLNGTLIVSGVLNFYRSHYQAFYMPLLAVGLGIFERPRLKEFKYSLVAFAVYYGLVLILNGW